MVFGAILGGAKALFGGGKKKKAAPKERAGPTEGEKLKGASIRTTKELLSPVKSTRKPIRGNRMRAGARKAISRGSSRAGGR